MYSFLELRRRDVLATCCALLEATMDPYRNFSYGYESNASAPSLRAFEQPPPPPQMSDDAGNVKVVVRCRAFVRRGL